MVDRLFSELASIAALVLGVALVAVLVSRNANTAGVLSAGGSAFSKIIGAAVSPVTGGSGFGATAYGPTGGFSGLAY